MNHRTCLPVLFAVLALGCESNSPTEIVDQSSQGLSAKSERGSITCDPNTADDNADGYVCTRLSDKRCTPSSGLEALEYRDNSLVGTDDPVGRCSGKWDLDAVPHPWKIVYEDPSTFALVGVWSSSATDVFVTGTEGAVVHFDGTTWTSQISGTDFEIFDLWGSSSTNVYGAVGDDDSAGQVGAILHYDGVTWTHEDIEAPYLVGIWGSSPSDVFAVGMWGTILHFDGHQWSQQTSGTTEFLWDVWGSSPTNVFAVGSGGTILHYDGISWSPQVSGTSVELRGVWVGSETSAFAVGWHSTEGTTTALAYDGSSWSVANDGFTTPAVLLGVWGRSPTDVYAVGNVGVWRYDGSSWTNEAQSSAGLWGIWGSDTEIYAAGFDYSSATVLRTRH